MQDINNYIKNLFSISYDLIYKNQAISFHFDQSATYPDNFFGKKQIIVKKIYMILCDIVTCS